jgi:TRAP-type C4-dicarboxylate transport system permease small subunit
MIRLYDRLIVGLAGLAGAAIAGVCLLIVYDVIARNLGLQPPRSTVALTEYALLYFTMAAAPYLVRVKGHIVVEVIYQRLSGGFQKHLDKVILVFCALVSLVISTLAMLLLLESLTTGEIEIRSMDTPRWVLFIPLTGGFFLMTLEFIRLLMKRDSIFRSQAEQRETI